MDISEQLKRSYKKLKASVYFDKTQLILRDKIVDYEKNTVLPSRFDELADMLQAEDDKDWKAYEVKLLSDIGVLVFPKKLCNDDKNKIIINESPDEVKVDEIQCFIDLDVEGQILGILWTLTIGFILDSDVYEHSYGNRLKKGLINEETENTTFSPYLFKPYFEQYERWRDIGLSYAEKCIDAKQDVFIFTMDLKRYFYSVSFTEEHFKNFYELFKDANGYTNTDLRVVNRINQFVYRVMEKYSKKVEWEDNRGVFLPIGFYPSNILSNWYLSEFDSAISNRWNPVYYGRYVDDIIIVEKIEKNSEIYRKSKANNLTQEDIINHFLCNCPANSAAVCKENLGLLEQLPKCKYKTKIYKIGSKYIHGDSFNVLVQNDKVKVFYFKAGSTKAILTNFRKAINENKSEFR
ncbi:MAG: hypothetical protein ACRCZK_04445, partial [Oscillospiraceae bacterium]